MKLNRKIGTVVSVAMALACLAGCSSGATESSSSPDVTSGDTEETTLADTQSGETRTLVVSTWGANAEGERTNIYEPFEKKYNCKIVVEEGNNGERLSKLEQNPEAYDVVDFADYYALQAIEKGLIAKIDTSELTNLDALYDKAKAPNGEDYGPAFTFNRIGIMYDKSVITEPITSWSDLWRSDLAGMVAIPDISTTAGPMMLNIAANELGLDLSADNTDQVFDKMKEMSPNVVKYYTKSADVINMFNQGEVSVAVLQDFSSSTIKEASDDFVWIDPVEGTWGCSNVCNISSGSKNKDLAMKYIDFKLSKEVQDEEAFVGYNAPTRTDVVLTDEQSASMTYGAKQVDSIKYPDWKLFLDNKKDWVDTWNNVLNSQG